MSQRPLVVWSLRWWIHKLYLRELLLTLTALVNKWDSWKGAFWLKDLPGLVYNLGEGKEGRAHGGQNSWLKGGTPGWTSRPSQAVRLRRTMPTRGPGVLWAPDPILLPHLCFHRQQQKLRSNPPTLLRTGCFRCLMLCFSWWLEVPGAHGVGKSSKVCGDGGEAGPRGHNAFAMQIWPGRPSSMWAGKDSTVRHSAPAGANTVPFLISLIFSKNRQLIETSSSSRMDTQNVWGCERCIPDLF